MAPRRQHCKPSHNQMGEKERINDGRHFVLSYSGSEVQSEIATSVDPRSTRCGPRCETSNWCPKIPLPYPIKKQQLAVNYDPTDNGRLPWVQDITGPKSLSSSTREISTGHAVIVGDGYFRFDWFGLRQKRISKQNDDDPEGPSESPHHRIRRLGYRHIHNLFLPRHKQISAENQPKRVETSLPITPSKKPKHERNNNTTPDDHSIQNSSRKNNNLKTKYPPMENIKVTAWCRTCSAEIYPYAHRIYRSRTDCSCEKCTKKQIDHETITKHKHPGGGVLYDIATFTTETREEYDVMLYGGPNIRAKEILELSDCLNEEEFNNRFNKRKAENQIAHHCKKPKFTRVKLLANHEFAAPFPPTKVHTTNVHTPASKSGDYSPQPNAPKEEEKYISRIPIEEKERQKAKNLCKKAMTFQKGENIQTGN